VLLKVILYIVALDVCFGVAIVMKFISDREREEFLSARKEAGRKIDPEAAEFTWSFTCTIDPYGIYDLTEEERGIGRVYYARSVDSDIWVSFGDLPESTRDALWARICSGALCERDDWPWDFC
jgi:hypothetical protein